MNLRKPQKVVKQIAGYELLTRLGEGGNGTVFKARQPGLDRLVALKILSPKLSHQSEYLKRFQNEAKAAGAVNHKNIVQVLAAGFDSKIRVPYIVYEFIDGVTLTQLIERRRGLPEIEALSVVRAIASALGELKRHNIIHRDLKPDNILVTRSGIPKLTDLGLAKQENDLETLTETGIVMGTPDFMAPEQATGKRDLDITTDIYALGLTLYVMLTARLPYSGGSLAEILRQHIQVDCPDPRLARPNVTEQCSRLLAHMTRRNRRFRYSDSAELIRDIDLVLKREPLLGPDVKAKVVDKKKTGRQRRGSGRQKSMAGPRQKSKPGHRSKSQKRRRKNDPVSANTLNLAESGTARRKAPEQGFDWKLLQFFLAGAMVGVLMFVFLRVGGGL